MVKLKSEFYKIKNHGFYKVSVASPILELGDLKANYDQICRLTKLAEKAKSNLIVFPELCLTGYSLADNFHQRAFLDEVTKSLGDLVNFSKKTNLLITIGAPLEVDNCLYNCALVIQSGKILGINAKSYLPNYNEYYEKRYFSSFTGLNSFYIKILGQKVLFGNNLIYTNSDKSDIKIYFEICEDAWTVAPKAAYACLAGASLVVNLSASNALVGKKRRREDFLKSKSEQYLSGYLYSSAGVGESTTDLIFDGQSMIIELGTILDQTQSLSFNSQLVTSSIDFDLIQYSRRRRSSFVDQAKEYDSKFLEISFVCKNWQSDTELYRKFNRYPFCPKDLSSCQDTIYLQAHSIAKRLRAAKIEKIVLGLSGGLDSCLAALVGVKTLELLNLASSNLLIYQLPSKANSKKTIDNALALIKALKLTSKKINIDKMVEQTKRDMKYKELIKDTGASADSDIVFENIQAGVRASLLFREANRNSALVLGTGDLSELALGFTTYGVGDHMSHYNPNSSLAKTQIKEILRYLSNYDNYSLELREAIKNIVETDISPELSGLDNNDKPSQLTEEIIGPYELNDFFLYNKINSGFAPSKVAYLAYQVFTVGSFFDTQYQNNKLSEQFALKKYSINEIYFHLERFYKRFVSSQFKRSSMPDGAKVGSTSLSPRGDWRSPSDLSNKTFLKELKKFHS